MLRSLFGISSGRARATVTHQPRRKDRRCRLDYLLRLESLEARALLTAVDVHLTNDFFTPSAVTIHVGDTIHWINDQGFHSTTSVAGSAESWNFGPAAAPWTF